MKVVKIYKSYRNASVEGFIITKTIDSKEAIECFVEEWCEREGGGMNYGYSYKWEFVEDKEIINSVIKKEYIKLGDSIKGIDKKRYELWEYLNKEVS